MERSLVVDARVGHLGLAAQYLQAGLQGGAYEGAIEGCDTPLESVLLEVQSAACAGALVLPYMLCFGVLTRLALTVACFFCVCVRCCHPRAGGHDLR